MTKGSLLLVEDDQFANMLMKVYFENLGYDVQVACDAQEARKAYRLTSFDLIFMDLDLPDEDGLVLLRQFMTEVERPFIVLTGRSNKSDKIAALEMGAIEYLVKPVDPHELSLRVANILNLVHGRGRMSKNILNVEGVVLDRGAQTVTNRQGETQALTPGEFLVLSTLFNAPNRVLSRDYLLDVMNSEVDTVSTRSVDVIISRVRKKIDDPAREKSLISTVTGAGYIVKI